MRELLGTRSGKVAVGLVVATVVVSLFLILRPDGPEDVVEDFFDAVREKDVAAAMELITDAQVRPGDGEGAFLAPEAIADDWELVEAEETGEDAYGHIVVKATISGPQGTASGELRVRETEENGWRLSDPFVDVEFEASGLNYAEVNGVRKLTPDRPRGSFALFPGVYRFYTAVPGHVGVAKAPAVAAFPDSGGNSRPIHPGTLKFSDELLADVESQLLASVKECAGSGTDRPGCGGFATDGAIDTADGKRVDDPTDLTWRDPKLPAMTLTDRAFGPHGLAIAAAKPGTIRLTGQGEDSDGKPVRFAVTCRMLISGGYGVQIDRTGQPKVTFTGQFDPVDGIDSLSGNTCLRAA